MRKLRVTKFTENDADLEEEFEARETYERHFHGFYRTLLEGLPWRFAQKNIDGDGDQSRRKTIEVHEDDDRLADAIEDLRTAKPEQLFSCGAWGGIAFNRWLKVDKERDRGFAIHDGKSMNVK